MIASQWDPDRKDTTQDRRGDGKRWQTAPDAETHHRRMHERLRDDEDDRDE
jgi:hypothetical protein